MRLFANRKVLQVACLLLVAVSAVGLHPLLLRAIAVELISSDRIEPVGTVFLVSGDRDYVVAATLFAGNQTQRIVQLREPSPPLVACRILESGNDVALRELARRGVPATALAITDREVLNIWEIADRVRDQLAEQPNDRVAMLVDSLHTRRLRYVLARSLSDRQLAQVRIYAIRDRRFDESNWWRSRVGLKGVINAYLRYVHNLTVGRPEQFPPLRWSPQSFEDRIRARQQGAA